MIFNIDSLSKRDSKLKTLEEHFESNTDAEVKQRILNEYLYLLELNIETVEMVKNNIKWEIRR